MLVDDELAAMCLKKFIDVQRNGLPKDAYDFKCVKCSNRGGREYYKDDTIVVVCKTCGQLFLICTSHPIHAVNAKGSSASQPQQTEKSDDTVFKWLGELFSAISGGA